MLSHAMHGLRHRAHMALGGGMFGQEMGALRRPMMGMPGQGMGQVWRGAPNWRPGGAAAPDLASMLRMFGGFGGGAPRPAQPAMSPGGMPAQPAMSPGMPPGGMTSQNMPPQGGGMLGAMAAGRGAMPGAAQPAMSPTLNGWGPGAIAGGGPMMPPPNVGPPAGGGMSAPGMPTMLNRPPPNAGGLMPGGLGGALGAINQPNLGGIRPSAPTPPSGPPPMQFGDEAFFGQLAQNNPGLNANLGPYKGPIGPGAAMARGGLAPPPGMPAASPLPMMPRRAVSPLTSLIGQGMAAQHAGFPGPRKPRIPMPGQLRNINQPINRIRPGMV